MDENPNLLNKTDRQAIYEIIRERLLTEGFTYFTNLREAKENFIFEKRHRLNENNKAIFESYEHYLKKLCSYFNSPNISALDRFNLTS